MEDPAWSLAVERRVKAKDVVRWSKRFPRGKLQLTYTRVQHSNPIAADGRLFATNFNPGAILALSLTDGAKLWCQNLHYLASGILVAHDGIVYGGTPASLVALDMQTGTLIWEFVPSGTANVGIYSEPVLLEGDILISDRAGRTHRLDGKTGEAKWTRKVCVGEANANGTAAISAGLAIIGTNESTVVACRLTDGEVAWRTEVDGPGAQAIAVDEERIAVIGRHMVYWLDALTGAARSTIEFPGEEIEVAIRAEERLLVVLCTIESFPAPDTPEMRFNPTRLLCLLEGEELWSLTYPPYPMPRLVFDEELDVLFETTSYGLSVIDVNAGKRVSVVTGFPTNRALNISEDRLTPPCRVGDLLYAFQRSGTLFAIDWTRLL